MMRLSAIRSALHTAGAVMAVGVLYAATAAAQAPPLGEVARKEADRRKAQPAAGKVYTNKDLPESAQSRTPPPPSGGAAEPDPAAPAAEKQPAAERPARNEAWWKDRMVKAREALRRDEVLAESLQSRINVLSRDFVSRDNPVQRARIGQERADALEELARVRAAIELGKQQIDEIEEEARRAGVPPGWLR
jgi:hypothetical protein